MIDNEPIKLVDTTSLQHICKEYEGFLLHEGNCRNNSVIIRDMTEDVLFVLQGSYHLQIAARSICGEYIISAFDADYEKNYKKGWEIIDTFTSKEELETFIGLHHEVVYKSYFGNGMTVYLFENYLQAKRDDYVYEDQHLYYVDEETGLVYQEYSVGFNTEFSDTKIAVMHDADTYLEKDYYGPGKNEELFYQVQFGIEGLKHYYKRAYTDSSLQHMFSKVNYKITKLGVL